MDYATFVRLRRPLWEDLARQLQRLRLLRPPRAGEAPAIGYDELEAVAFSYRQALQDHALAASRFPGTGAARELASLALTGTRLLTRQAGRRPGLRHFVLVRFPAAFQRHLPLLGLAATVFGAAALCGLALSAAQPRLGEALLGPRAVERLAAGHLWTESLSTSVPPALASSGIATNNLAVALVSWTGGILAGLVPFCEMILNGLLLGSLVGVTLRFAMAGELLSFVAAHGMLEITLLLVSAAAGLAIGRALVAAGDRPRAVALREAGADSLVVMLGSLPWFVVLAVVEARISPDPSIPVAFKTALGLGLVLVYLGVALAPPHLSGGGDAAAA
jgi:uncharacterized membrane protein SpoIIM required for sporulation